jgi:bifunctional DNA-binding transcriptional regulator/antitoxin component of YhaV-PrlF toxin-antitoxin module
MDERGRITLPMDVRRELGIAGTAAATLVVARTRRGTYELFPSCTVPQPRIWFHDIEMQHRRERIELVDDECDEQMEAAD